MQPEGKKYRCLIEISLMANIRLISASFDCQDDTKYGKDILLGIYLTNAHRKLTTRKANNWKQFPFWLIPLQQSKVPAIKKARPYKTRRGSNIKQEITIFIKIQPKQSTSYQKKSDNTKENCSLIYFPKNSKQKITIFHFIHWMRT